MWLLASVRPDVPGLMLQPMKSLIAQRALLRTGQFVGCLGWLSSREWAIRPQHSDSGHVALGLVLP